MKDSFARKGVEIEAALTPAGEIDYIYVVGRLLAVDRGDNVGRLQVAMPRVATRRRGRAARDRRSRAAVNRSMSRSTEGEAGSLTVPEMLDRIDVASRDSPGPAGRACGHAGPYRAHLEEQPGWGTGGAGR